MSKASKIVLGFIAVVLIAAVLMLSANTHQSQTNGGGSASGSGTPTVFDNVNLFGVLKLPVTTGNPTVTTSCPSGSQLDLNGSCIYVVRQAITSGTTTPCSIASPAATSSLIAWSFNPSTGTSTTAYVDLATSTTAFATTSKIATFPAYVSNSANGALSWNGGYNNNVVYPSTYVNILEAAGTASGGFIQSGYCSATFQTL